MNAIRIFTQDMSLIFWQSYKIHLGEKLSLRPLVKFSFHCRELAAFTVENKSLHFSDLYKMQIFDLLHKCMYFFRVLHCRYLKPGDSSHTGYCWSPSSQKYAREGGSLQWNRCLVVNSLIEFLWGSYTYTCKKPKY